MNFEILDKVVYKTTQYLICGDDGIEYSIEEYDGMEHVAEAHRTWG